ncbi:tetratricopeptide repeat protein [Micromonospora gifhornensis]|uniref:tetratricopeptide repeat protein n=1 Tax=Micromonospora gifhornensis TaxID=84594 RepID=UPI0034554DA0
MADPSASRGGNRVRPFWLIAVAVGLLAGGGGLASFLAQTPSPTVMQYAYAAIGALAAAGATLVALPRGRPQVVLPEPAPQVRRMVVVSVVVDQNWAEWIADTLRSVDNLTTAVTTSFDQSGQGENILLVLSSAYESVSAADRAKIDRLAATTGVVTVLVEQTHLQTDQPAEMTRSSIDLRACDDSAGAALALVHGLIAADIVPFGTRLEAAAGFPGNVPGLLDLPPPAPYFRGREDVLRSVFRQLWLGSLREMRAGPRVHLLTGLGGIGKSSIAIEFAIRYERRYEVIWWIAAEQTTLVRTRLLELAGRVGVPADDDPARRLQELWSALDRRGAWLIVFDNVDDDSNLVAHWPPVGSRGHILLTSRLNHWGDRLHHEAVSTVGELPRAESVALLLERSPSSAEYDADLLAETLGDMALAIDHAATFMARTSLTCADYLHLYNEARRLVSADGTRRTQTIATTRRLSVQRAVARAPGAADLLAMLAMLAPDDVPRTMIPSHAGELPQPFAAIAAAPQAYLLAEEALAAYHLIKLDTDRVDVHRLVQDAVCGAMTADERSTWLLATARVLRAAFPDRLDDPVTWPTAGRLTAHVLAVSEVAGELSTTDAVSEAISELQYLVGSSLMYRGSDDQAAAILERCVAFRRRVYGEQSFPVAEALTRLAETRHRLADLSPALDAAATAHEILWNAPDADVDLMLDISRWLISVQVERNNLADATRMLSETDRWLRDHVGGADHRLGDLDAVRLGVLWRRGLLDEALVAARAVWDSYEEKPRSTARQRAVAAKHIGLIQRDIAARDDDVGVLTEALGWYERAAEEIEAEYGPDDAEAARIKGDMGSVLLLLGRRKAAGVLLTEAYEAVVEKFGATHPNAIAIAGNLAWFLAQTGEHGRALDLLRDARSSYAERYGEEHPYVAETMHYMARVHLAMGDRQRASELFAETIERVQQSYGADHTKVTTLTAEMQRVRNLSEAGTAQQRILGILLRVVDSAKSTVWATARLVTQDGLSRPGVRCRRDVHRRDAGH